MKKLIIMLVAILFAVSANAQEADTRATNNQARNENSNSYVVFRNGNNGNKIFANGVYQGETFGAQLGYERYFYGNTIGISASIVKNQNAVSGSYYRTIFGRTSVVSFELGLEGGLMQQTRFTVSAGDISGELPDGGNIDGNYLLSIHDQKYRLFAAAGARLTVNLSKKFALRAGATYQYRPYNGDVVNLVDEAPSVPDGVVITPTTMKNGAQFEKFQFSAHVGISWFFNWK